MLSGGKVKTNNTNEGLHIALDQKALKPVVSIIELTIGKNASDLPAITTLGDPIFFDAELTSSSDKSEVFTAKNLLPGAKADFSEGIHIKKSWFPAKEDKTPSLTFTWEKEQNISQITIQEGRRLGNNHEVESFEILFKEKGKWKTLYKGTNIGPFFNLILEKPLHTTALKIQVNKLKGSLEINKVGIYAK